MNTNIARTDDKPSARERILFTAHRLFYNEGIRATGIDRVIAEAGVTKVTFYRHFPSKNDLILAFLDCRHQQWMAWFIEAVGRYGGNLDALVPALSEWFRNDGFRGCAFLNSVSELGAVMPEVAEITRRHKQDMASVIVGLLPLSRQRKRAALAVAVAIDGAIMHAQFDHSPDAALQSLDWILKSFQSVADR